MMNILVTGGNGFIGKHLVAKLCNLQYNIVVIDDNSNAVPSALIDGVTYIEECVSKVDMMTLFDKYKFKYVFHLAAQVNLRRSLDNPKADANSNILGTINLLEGCVKYGSHLIYSSTGGAIYDEKADLPWTEDTTVNPKSFYGLSKWASEMYIKIYHRLYNLHCTILRYSNVYGPGQNHLGEAGVVSIFMDKIKNNSNLTIFGDGTQTRDFVYVSDVVEANILAMKLHFLDVRFDIFNICSNSETSIASIAEYLIKMSNSDVKIDYSERNYGECIKTRLSFDKFNRMTNWRPKVSILDGLNKVIGL